VALARISASMMPLSAFVAERALLDEHPMEALGRLTKRLHGKTHTSPPGEEFGRQRKPLQRSGGRLAFRRLLAPLVASRLLAQNFSNERGDVGTVEQAVVPIRSTTHVVVRVVEAR
jgi:hypothetical protein